MLLTRPLVFFDLETTGTNTQLDKIISIAIIKINTDSTREEKSMLLNPGIPIPPSSTKIHGITDEMVQGKRTFKQISKSLNDQLFGCDLAGFNSDSFDLSMMIQEFHRCAIEFPNWDPSLVDCYKIEKKINSHKLDATYKRYTGQELEGAHDAMVDTKATETVLGNQIEKIDRVLDVISKDKVTPKFLDSFCQGDKKRFDYAGRCYIDGNDGIIKWSFGKNINEPVLKDRGYLNWVLNSDFPIQTKKKLKELLINKD